MKIRMLVDKIKADFLIPTRAQLEIELSRTPMTVTYDQALSLFRYMVNQKHPPQMGAAQNRTRRNVNEVVTAGRGGGRNTSRGGHGRGGRGARGFGRGGRGGVRRSRTDSRIITLTDGTQIEYHPSFNFPRHVFMKMRQEDRDTLRRERQTYNDGQRQRSEIQELRSQVQELGGSVRTSNSPPPSDSVAVSQHSQVSQMTSTTNHSIMGGRNEQAQNRQSRRAGAVMTRRCIKSSTTLANRPWIDPPANTSADNECDTNADTCCLGKNFIVLNATFRTADVYAYDASIKPIENVPTVSGATAYDDPITGHTFILVFNESLYYGDKLDHSLINPNQLRAYGIPLWDNPYDTMHSLSIDVDTTLSIPLRAFSTKVGFRTRVPTSDKLRTCIHIPMTSSRPWNPTEVVMVQSTAQGGNVYPWKRKLATTSAQFPRSEYIDAKSDVALLDSVDPSLAQTQERLQQTYRVSQIETVYDQLDTPARRTFVSNKRHAKVSAELIAERFGIGPTRAQRTMRVTTQRGVRSAILPISRRYRADRVFNVKRLNGKFAFDTAYGKFRSLRGNVGCQIYSHKCGFKAAYPMQRVDGDNVGDTLTQFISDYGVPEHLTYDGASVQTGPKTRFMDAIRRYEVKYHVSGPRRPNENPAEKSIHEVKKRWYRIMLKRKVPARLWDCGFSWVCGTENICADLSKYAEGRTPIEIITGNTPDISEYLDFDFYDWVMYRTNAGLGEVELGRWLGVSHRVGRMMSYWILPISGIPVSVTTVQRLTNDERNTNEMKTRMDQFDAELEVLFDVHMADITGKLRDIDPSKVIDPEDEDPGFFQEFTRVIDDATLKHVDD
jgi:hypothetical protein